MSKSFMLKLPPVEMVIIAIGILSYIVYHSSKLNYQGKFVNRQCLRATNSKKVEITKEIFKK